jgi:hypothetical protein
MQGHLSEMTGLSPRRSHQELFIVLEQVTGARDMEHRTNSLRGVPNAPSSRTARSHLGLRRPSSGNRAGNRGSATASYACWPRPTSAAPARSTSANRSRCRPPDRSPAPAPARASAYSALPCSCNVSSSCPPGLRGSVETGNPGRKPHAGRLCRKVGASPPGARSAPK